jgi:hypothetical protein
LTTQAVWRILCHAIDGCFGGALQFFFYDTPKVLMLLTDVVFIMGMIDSYFTPERTQAAYRAGRKLSNG